MGGVEAAVPRDDWWPRRTSEWKEPGPKAKEWETEEPWSGWESGALSLHSIESSPQQAFPRFRAWWLCCPASPGPWGVFPGWTERLHVCGLWVAGAGRLPGEAWGPLCFALHSCEINSWVWSGLFVRELWSRRSLLVTLSEQRGCVLWPAPRGVAGKVSPAPRPMSLESPD